MTIGCQFGYFPEPLDFIIGDVTVSSLDDLDESVKSVNECEQIEKDWLYAPAARNKDFMSGAIRTLPYSARVFGLPETHRIEHASASDVEHVRFLVWALGFIHGMRLTYTEAGFLDATPIKPGKLHDIVWLGKSDQIALGLADSFWLRHTSNPRISKAVVGIIHSLFLSQTPTHLCYEQFIYLYTALDGCHYVHSHLKVKGQKSLRVMHSERIANLCAAFNCPVPTWADSQTGDIAKHRNETLHEGLFFDEPLGFRVFGGTGPSGSHQNILLEMQGLVCRFLCAMLGFNDPDYIASRVDTRQQIGLQL